jgi:hypothetical protein
MMRPSLAGSSDFSTAAFSGFAGGWGFVGKFRDNRRNRVGVGWTRVLGTGQGGSTQDRRQADAPQTHP